MEDLEAGLPGMVSPEIKGNSYSKFFIFKKLYAFSLNVLTTNGPSLVCSTLMSTAGQH